MAGLVSVLKAAESAGLKAADAAVPVPMVVVERANPLDDSSPVVRRYAPVMSGVCGFAWVWMKGGSKVANAAKKRYENDRGDVLWYGKGYPSGVNISVMGYGQSMERKMAFAGAYAEVLRAAGFEAYADSRMD